MAGQDIPMNGFPVVADAKYVYTEKGDGGQGRMELVNLEKIIGVFSLYTSIGAGSQIVLPYTAGLIIMQFASHTHERALALLNSNGNGTIMVNGDINFFSEKEGCICVYNTGINTNYVVKNTYPVSKTVSITFIKN